MTCSVLCMTSKLKQYIDELKKGFTGAVTIGERDGPSLGGAQFTNEFRDYAKSMGYEIDRGMSANGRAFVPCSARGLDTGCV
jgi:hypothetical protein